MRERVKFEFFPREEIEIIFGKTHFSTWKNNILFRKLFSYYPFTRYVDVRKKNSFLSYVSIHLLFTKQRFYLEQTVEPLKQISPAVIKTSGEAARYRGNSGDRGVGRGAIKATKKGSTIGSMVGHFSHRNGETSKTR